MPLDMLDRLILDPGSRTLEELRQEREWAVWEIRRLRTDLGRLCRKQESSRIEKALEQAVDLALSAQRLLRLAEVTTMIGLKRPAIYRYVSEGRFPAPIAKLNKIVNISRSERKPFLYTPGVTGTLSRMKIR